MPLPPGLYGFGSIFGKTIRDSTTWLHHRRRATRRAVARHGRRDLPSVFPTPESRLEVGNLIGGMPPEMVDFFGKPVALGTLGGYLTWKYGLVFVLTTTVWSILGLSSTLAGESSRGSLDLVATVPFGRRRIALEKLAAHATIAGPGTGLHGPHDPDQLERVRRPVAR